MLARLVTSIGRRLGTKQAKGTIMADNDNNDNSNHDVDVDVSDNDVSSSSSLPATSTRLMSGRLTLLPPLVLMGDADERTDTRGGAMILLLPTRRTIRVVAGTSGQVLAETTIGGSSSDDNDEIVAWCTGTSRTNDKSMMSSHNLVILGYKSGMVQIWAVLVGNNNGSNSNDNNNKKILLDHRVTIPMPEAGGRLMDVAAATAPRTPSNNNKTTSTIQKSEQSDKQASPYPDIVALVQVEETTTTTATTTNDNDYEEVDEGEENGQEKAPPPYRYRVYRHRPSDGDGDGGDGNNSTWQKVWTVPRRYGTGCWVRAFGATNSSAHHCKERGGLVVAGGSFLCILRGGGGGGNKVQEQRLPCRLQDGRITCLAVSAPAQTGGATSSSSSSSFLWIAAGFAKGSIRLYNGLKNNWVDHPPRRLHWHAHAVKSLAFGNGGGGDADVLLHSVGEESVWIQWDNVNDRPRTMLPRIAPTGIDHVVAMSNNNGRHQQMLLHANNTILLYEIMTQGLVWRYQGIHERATIHGVLGGGGNSTAMVLSGSAGVLHVVADRRVQRTWRVAPYNRVSRMDRSGPEIPPPRLIHVQQSSSSTSIYDESEASSSSWWLTIHETVYESSPPNVVVQFWDRPDHCVSAMVLKEPILACALQVPQAVLLTKTDIQLWDGIGDGGGSGSGATTGGTSRKGAEQKQRQQSELPSCRTKIPIPAGFANQTVHANPVYSDDGSLLAIAFGRYITLWNPISVRLLSMIPLIEDIHQMAFVMDGLVVRTQSEVCCMSILGNEHWQYDIMGTTAMATARDMVVVGNATRIVVLDAFTGQVSRTVKHKHGGITSMHAGLERNHQVRIIVTTQRGELLDILDVSLDGTNNDNSTTTSSRVDNARVDKAAPTLPAFHERSKKRQFLEISDLEDWCPSKIAPMEQLADDELPLLRGEFVMAFLGRNLRRKLQEASI